jgi:uncharacterized phosphosugar-binding protein
MHQARNRYRNLIVATLDRILQESGTAIDQTVAVVAKALAANHIISFAGSGHSHLIALEAFYRAGGIAQAQAILEPDLMLHLGAQRSTQAEREPGRAADVLARYDITPGDVLFVASNSGRNAYPVELALEGRRLGATVIAITSLAHAKATRSRHPSGKRLYELADIVLDNAGIYGDAALEIAGHEVSMGPTSTIAGVFLVNAILAEAVETLAAKGIAVDVYESANRQGGEAATEDLIRRWQPRIKGL